MNIFDEPDTFKFVSLLWTIQLPTIHCFKIEIIRGESSRQTELLIYWSSGFIQIGWIVQLHAHHTQKLDIGGRSIIRPQM